MSRTVVSYIFVACSMLLLTAPSLVAAPRDNPDPKAPKTRVIHEVLGKKCAHRFDEPKRYADLRLKDGKFYDKMPPDRIEVYLPDTITVAELKQFLGHVKKKWKGWAGTCLDEYSSYGEIVIEALVIQVPDGTDLAEMIDEIGKMKGFRAEPRFPDSPSLHCLQNAFKKDGRTK